jgi:dihydrofolate reductase
LHDVQTNAVLINSHIEEKVQQLKKEEGKNIWLFGGASLTTSFLKAGLIDELLLAIHPIILGAGKALFIGIDNRISLILKDSKTYESGLVQNSYEVVR